MITSKTFLHTWRKPDLFCTKEKKIPTNFHCAGSESFCPLYLLAELQCTKPAATKCQKMTADNEVNQPKHPSEEIFLCIDVDYLDVLANYRANGRSVRGI
jgi:hypothetical protein